MRYLLLAGMVGWSWGVWAQSSSSKPILSPTAAYDQSIGNQSHLYNGSSFKEFPVHENEHPYFISAEPTEGLVVYDGQLYPTVSIQYNLVTDRLITEDGASGREIQLVPRGISSFQMFGRKFISITDDRSLADGFYELAFDGQRQVLVRYEKSLQHKMRENISMPWYQTRTRTYIGEHGNYFVAKSKKLIWQMAGARKDALKKHLRQQHVRFKADKQRFCAIALQFIETSTAN